MINGPPSAPRRFNPSARVRARAIEFSRYYRRRVQPPARRLNNEHLKAKAARVLTMQPGENRRFPGRISDAAGHIRRNRPRANAPQANRCFSQSGRHVEEQLGGERARPGERRRCLRGAYGWDGRRLRDRGLRVRVEEPEGRDRGTGE